MLIRVSPRVFGLDKFNFIVFLKNLLEKQKLGELFHG